MNILGIYQQQIEFSKMNIIKRGSEKQGSRNIDPKRSILFHNMQTKSYKKNADIAMRMYSLP
jgi:hypothetical protein